jgi:hypothetical protein
MSHLQYGLDIMTLHSMILLIFNIYFIAMTKIIKILKFTRKTTLSL